MTYIQDLKAEETAFKTTALLTTTDTFTSVIIDVDGYTQVQTEVLSSHDGTISISFYEDLAGLNLIRSLNIPYVAANGYQFFSAPAFVNFIKYEFTNDALVTQTEFYYTTKILRTALSPQVLTADAFISPSMVMSLNRNIVVGQDSDGVFRNVHTTKGGDLATAITDANLGFHAIVTPGGGLKTNESTHLIGEPFGGAAINSTEWTISLTGSGTQDATGPGELTMDTGITANSSAAIESSNIARFIPANYNTTHHAITIPDGASYVANNSRKWGAFNSTSATCDGIYYEIDSGSWFVVHCLAGTPTRIPFSSWNGNGVGSFPINSINANVYEIEYNAGSIIFRVNNNVMHRETLLTTPYATDIHFPVGMSNTNTGGSVVDVSLKIRAAAIYTLGKGTGTERPYYIAGTTGGVLIKSGPGRLGRIVFARAGGGGGAATILIYDAASGTNQIGRIDISKDDTITIVYDIDFNIGLYVEIAGSGTLGTTITFD